MWKGVLEPGAMPLILVAVGRDRSMCGRAF